MFKFVTIPTYFESITVAFQSRPFHCLEQLRQAALVIRTRVHICTRILILIRKHGRLCPAEWQEDTYHQ